MLNSSPKATTSMCSDTTEARYQKALKEINKLININNDLKEASKDHEQYVASIQKDLKDAQNMINEILIEKEQLQRQLEDLTNKHRDLEEDYLELQRRKQQPKKQEYVNRAPIHHHEMQNIRNSSHNRSENSSYVKKIEQLELKVEFQQNKIDELQKTNDWKKVSLSNQNHHLKEKIKQLEEGFKELENYRHGKYTIYSDQKMRQMTREELLKKLKIVQLWNKNTVQECVQLKSKLLKIQNQENILLRIKSEKQLPTAKIPTARNMLLSVHNRNENSTQLIKKLNKMTQERNVAVKKYETIKQKLDKFDDQFTSLMKQNEKNAKVIEAYEKVFEKQEETIKKLVEEFEQDIKKMTEDFKEKINEQRENFGPSHQNQKHLKAIQSLQSQNKSLKKKFQMCSIELTKCFKTLQVYKTKLAEYQFSYNELMKENEALSQKLVSLSKPDPSVKSRNNTGGVHQIAQSQGDEEIQMSLMRIGKNKGVKNLQY